MLLNLDTLNRSIAALRRTLEAATDTESASEKMREAMRAGVVQNFEVAYEQSWKMMKRWLQINLSKVEVDGVTRRELFRVAAQQKLIDDIDQWMLYHDARNRTSHTYNEEVVDEVNEAAKDFLEDAESLLKQLEKRNG